MFFGLVINKMLF